MAADANGNIWFGEFSIGMLAFMDVRTHEISEYATPTQNSGPYSVDTDKTRNLIWVNEMMADKIACFSPVTRSFLEYPIPTKNSSVRRIELDPSRLTRGWYASIDRDEIGFLDAPE